LEREPDILSPGHRLLGPPVQRGLWKYYYVHFGRELAIGERVEVRVRQELYDYQRAFEPFLSKVVVEPIDHLVLRVAFPRDRLPSGEVVGREMSAEDPTGVLIQTVPCKVDMESREVRWDIPSPIVGRMYELRWRWI
jgi:hypothetical protein